jgi:hypothetical protein
MSLNQVMLQLNSLLFSMQSVHVLFEYAGDTLHNARCAWSLCGQREGGIQGAAALTHKLISDMTQW